VRTSLKRYRAPALRRGRHLFCARRDPDHRIKKTRLGKRALHSDVGAQALYRNGAFVDDFVFSQGEGVLPVRNTQSPAATACLAIARRIVGPFEGVSHDLHAQVPGLPQITTRTPVEQR
jgi:hypothetical protein